MAVKMETVFHTWMGLQSTAFLEDSQAIDIKIQSGMPVHVIIPYLGLYPRETATQICKGIYLNIACNFKNKNYLSSHRATDILHDSTSTQCTNNQPLKNQGCSLYSSVKQKIRVIEKCHYTVFLYNRFFTLKVCNVHFFIEKKGFNIY